MTDEGMQAKRGRGLQRAERGSDAETIANAA